MGGRGRGIFGVAWFWFDIVWRVKERERSKVEMYQYIYIYFIIPSLPLSRSAPPSLHLSIRFQHP
jgi:hypothetical protein